MNEPKFRWTCLAPVGQPYWQGTEVFESDECGAEFETEEADFVTCPECGSELHCDYDTPERVEDSPKPQ